MKYIFEIDLAKYPYQNGAVMYCKTQDVFMEFVETVFRTGEPNLLKFSHPFVGDFFVNVETGEVYEAVITYKKY